jgi:putative transposase
MIAFIDDHRAAYGLEPRSGSRPICRVLPIAPSSYHEQAARGRDPDRAPARQKRDVELCREVRRVFEENFGVCGVRKVWRQMLRDGIRVARCTQWPA